MEGFHRGKVKTGRVTYFHANAIDDRVCSSRLVDDDKKTNAIDKSRPRREKIDFLRPINSSRRDPFLRGLLEKLGAHILSQITVIRQHIITRIPQIHPTTRQIAT